MKCGNMKLLVQIREEVISELETEIVALKASLAVLKQVNGTVLKQVNCKTQAMTLGMCETCKYQSQDPSWYCVKNVAKHGFIRCESLGNTCGMWKTRY